MKLSNYAILLQECGSAKALAEGKRVHALIIGCEYDRDRYLGNLLIQMYGKCGAVGDASAVFAQMPQRNEYSWAIMIGVYVDFGQAKEAFRTFRDMRLEGLVPDKVTLVSVLSACTNPAILAQGKSLHALVVGSGFDSDVIVGTAVLHMYSRCGTLQDAKKTFDKMTLQNRITWNAMITAFAEHGRIKEAFIQFQKMKLEGIPANRVTYLSILDACGSQETIVEGRLLHMCIAFSGLEANISIANALINMYRKCGSLEDTEETFNKMPEHDVISWTGIIAAYVDHGKGEGALHLFEKMQVKGMLPNTITFVAMLESCTNHATLDTGRLLHVRIVCAGSELDVAVGTALVCMYAKCGNVQDANKIFVNMPEWDMVLWTAMVGAFAQHGQGGLALQVFHQMQLRGMIPDKITLFDVLYACSHTGLVDEGCHCFISMTKDCSMTPSVEHYSCVVDLLGRAGLLDEAEALINVMPMGHTTTSWMSVLNACRMHLDVERGKRAAEHLVELDPENIVPHVLLSHIYAAVGKP